MRSAHRFVAGAFAATLLFVVLQPVTAETGSAPRRCGLTTLDGTIAFFQGHLECAAGDPLILRDDLHAAGAGAPTPLVSFAAMADIHLQDEESPLRGEFLDVCGQVPTKNAYKLQEAFEPQLVNSAVRAIDQVGLGPVTGRPFDFAVSLGDPTDNQQWNELRTFINLMDGSRMVDPDSGKRGYEGVQARDPYPSPVQGTSLRDLANEPFWTTGLRSVSGMPLPWYSVMGNHDRKVRGTVPNDLLAPGVDGPWMTLARQWATGTLRINDLPPDELQRVCDDPTVVTDPAFWAEVAANPQAVTLITADPNRRLVSPQQWVAEHLPPAQAKQADANALGSSGLPAGHGFGHPCTGADGKPLDRTCYSFDVAPSMQGEPPVHFIALDTSADEGVDTGNIDQAEWNWLNEDLKAHSKCFYDSNGTCTKTGHQNSIIVVMSHHSEGTMTNNAPRTDAGTQYLGPDLSNLLLKFPNVALHLDGHTHWDKVTPHPEPNGRPGGYWEINTASIIDWPNQARSIELADNHDGTISVYSVGIDVDAPVDPHAMRWSDDATPETALGKPVPPSVGDVTANVNEEMLASIGRWTAALDPQNGAAFMQTQLSVNGPADRNVNLILANPNGRVPLPKIKITLPNPRDLFPRPFPFPFPYQFPRNFRFPGRTIPPVFTPPPYKPQPYYLPTWRGVGSPAKDNRMPYRYPIEAGLGLVLGVWLYLARIRPWMVGA